MKKKHGFAGSAAPEEEARNQELEYKTLVGCVGFYELG